MLLVDTRGLESAARWQLAESDRRAWRLIFIGVEQPAERARLLAIGCADALPDLIGLNELAARARRVTEMSGMLPRWRVAGPLTLDLFHRDACCRGRWLALHPREFGVLWRLADQPGQQVTRQQLLRDVWRLNHEPGTNSVEVHVSRLRAKLGALGLAGMVMTVPRGGYRLCSGRRFMFALDPPAGDALDGYLREHAFWPAARAS